jgi:hypothetical protein
LQWFFVQNGRHINHSPGKGFGSHPEMQRVRKLDIVVAQDDAGVWLNDKRCESTKALPLKQGWNKVAVLLPK